MSLHIELDEELRDKFKIHAIKKKSSMKDLIVNFILEEVKEDGDSQG